MRASTTAAPQLRPSSGATAPVIEQVFSAVHAEQFLAAGIPPEVFGPLLDLQFRAQQAQYRAEHPDAVDHVIELDGQIVGRCFLDRRADVVRVLDVAVLPTWRRRGIASRVLADLQQEPGVGCVHLSVWRADEGARRFYDSLGYRLRAERPDGYLELCSTASTCTRRADQGGQAR